MFKSPYRILYDFWGNHTAICALLSIGKSGIASFRFGELFCTLFFWSVVIMIFRELAVTSIRLVVSGSSGIVIAANNLGKIKTCTQIACVIVCIAERVAYQTFTGVPTFMWKYLPFSILTTAVMLFFTVWSGINYIASYWKYMDPQK